MNIHFLEETVEYVAQAVMEIFSPNHDNYPSIGVQPFEGEPDKERQYK